MNKDCNWTFKYKENGKWKYDTECGYIAYFQRYSVYCPFCGKVVRREGENVNETI